MKKAATKAQQPQPPVSLGTKRQCPKCATKFYDFNKPEAVCPKCNVNQKAAPAKPKAVKKEKSVHVIEDDFSGEPEAENIEVSDEEIEKEVQALASQANQPPEAVRARLTREGALDRIRNRLRNDKALDFLYRRPA